MRWLFFCFHRTGRVQAHHYKYPQHHPHHCHHQCVHHCHSWALLLANWGLSPLCHSWPLLCVCVQLKRWRCASYYFSCVFVSSCRMVGLPHVTFCTFSSWKSVWTQSECFKQLWCQELPGTSLNVYPSVMPLKADIYEILHSCPLWHLCDVACLKPLNTFEISDFCWTPGFFWQETLEWEWKRGGRKYPSVFYFSPGSPWVSGQSVK